MTDVANKTVLITGAASGIGALLSEKLFQLGARLVLWDIDSEGLHRVASKLDTSSILCQTVDLANREQIRNASETTLRDVGPVDVLINNAGVISGESLLDLTEEQIEQTIAINTLAPIWLARAFMPAMVNKGHGHIVNVASAAGLVGAVKMTDYCASKFAVVGFNEALRLETKSLKQPVKTTVVCPFFVDTGMFEGVRTSVPFLLPLLRPDAVAERIIKAILRNQTRVLMPRLIHSISPSRLLPVRLFDRILGWLGVTTSMDAFRGRRT